MSERGRRRGAAWALALTAVVASAACSGPKEPLQISVKDFVTDVVYGAKSKAAVVPLPPNAVAPALFTDLARPAQPPPPGRLIEPRRPPITFPESCPTADAFAFPALLASTTATAPPPEAAYVFRNKGTLALSGANAGEYPLPELSGRKVMNVQQAGDGTFTFTVASELGPLVTKTAYHVVPTSAVTGQAGIFITGVATSTAKAQSTFSPTPPLQIMRFPVTVGDSWQAAAVDAAQRQTMRYTATVGQKQRIDACGVVIDTYPVTLDGTVIPCTPAPTGECVAVPAGSVGTTKATRFLDTYSIAPQYGGLAVAEQIDEAGNDATIDAGAGFHLVMSSHIDREPARPQRTA